MQDKRRNSTTGPFAKPLQQLLDKPLEKPLKRHGALFYRLRRDWPQIAGKELSAITEPVKLSMPRKKGGEGSLVLAVEPAAALMLQHAAPVLLERLAVHFGYRAIHRITLLQRSIAAGPQAAPRTGGRRPGLSVNLPETIDDPELRAALEGLAKALPRS